MKKYYGIIITVTYALIFRILVEFDVLELNSWSYMVIVPIIMGYLPFLLQPEVFIDSRLKAVIFPLSSAVLFLLIAFITRLEDLGCFIILLPPCALVSVLVSLSFRSFIRNRIDNKKKNLNKNGLFLIAIPILLGNIEKYVEKKGTNFKVSEKIIIDCPKQKIWNNLFAVPELTNYIDNSIYNYLGFPNPVKSEYNAETNTRLGYFNNGIILNEKVIELEKLRKLSFAINIDQSKLDNSQTFKHILKNENLVFNSITYHLKTINESKTELTLTCDYKIRTNIPYYGEFCSKNIISDFENKLLNALKKRIEQ